MLCQFAFSNFRSFKDEAFLDLYAEPIKDKEDSLIIDKDGTKILPVISIYGPNGSGKSTVLDALTFLRQIIVNPMHQFVMNEKIAGNEDIVENNFKDEKNKNVIHKFNKNCELIPTIFEITFRINEIEYKYELSMLKNEVVNENLYYRKILENNVNIVFERNGDEILKGNDIENISVEKIKKTVPLLSNIAAFYDVVAINNVVEWFMKMNYLNYNRSSNDEKIFIPKNEESLAEMIRLIKEMDLNISGIRVDEGVDGKIEKIFTKHTVDGEEFELIIEEESSGTRKIFSFLAKINICLRNGRLVIADELDAKLHPKLFGFIVSLFTNPKRNKNGAQLLITSHDIVNMNSDVFRRDEIWFCSLNPSNASNLYALSSFRDFNGKRPRNDEVYGKRYMEGKYGADPFINKGLNWGNNDE